MHRSYAVHHLQQKFESKKDIGVAALYCSYKDESRSSVVDLVAGAWRQLALYSTTVSQSVKLTYKTHLDRDTNLSIAEAAHALQSEVERFSRVFIVVDALDECPEEKLTRATLIRTLVKLRPKASLMFTSRPLRTIQNTLQATDPSFLQLEVKATSADIAIYAKSRIVLESRLERQVAQDPALEERIVETVSLNSQKM